MERVTWPRLFGALTVILLVVFAFLWMKRAQDLPGKPDSTVILTTSPTVFAAVPGMKPIYAFSPSIMEFRGSAYPNNFDFEIRDGKVTVKGKPWVGHMASCGAGNQYVVWDDNLIDNHDVDRASQFAYDACDTVSYIVPIPASP